MSPAEHKRLLVILHLVLGCFFVFGAVFGLLFGIFTVIVKPSPSRPEEIGIWIGIAAGFLFTLGMGLPFVIAAIAAWTGRPWSRKVLQAVGVFALFLPPLGTALGIYSLRYASNDGGDEAADSSNNLGSPPV